MAHEQSSGGYDSDDFDRLVQHTTGEPLLGPRQGALIDALTQRLGSGGPMNEHDLMTAAWLGKILNLTVPTSDREPPALGPSL